MSAADRRPPFYLGIDLGGTNIKSGVVDDTGRPLSSVSLETEAERGPGGRARQPGRGRPAGRRGERADLGRDRGRRAGLARDDGLPAGMLLDPPNLPGWTTCRSATCSPSGSASRPSSRTTPTPRPSASTGPARAGTRGAWCCSRSARGSAAGSSTTAGSSRAGTATAPSAATSSSRWRTPASARAARYGHLEAYASATALVKRAHEALERDSEPSLAPEALGRGR